MTPTSRDVNGRIFKLIFIRRFMPRSHNNFAIFLLNYCTKTISAMRYIQKRWSNHSHQLHAEAAAVPPGGVNLSPKEIKVLILMCKQYSTKQIAHLLKRSPETINTHKKSLRRKTGCVTEVGLAVFAVKNNLFLWVIIICCDGIM